MEGVVSGRVVKKGPLASFKVDVPGKGTIQCTVKSQMFEGGLSDGYVPQIGDRVDFDGNPGRPGTMQVYFIKKVI